MKLAGILLFPSICLGGFQEVPSSELYNYNQNVIKKNRKIKKRTRQKGGTTTLNSSLNLLLKQDKKISNLLEDYNAQTIVKKSSTKINALTRVKGTLLNSVLAMNVRPAKFIIRLSNDIEELESSELRCLGYSFQKRIPSKCDLLVINEKEYSVDVELWDLDGAEGIIADYFYSGEEKSFLTSSLASFFQGTLDVAKSRISTPFGNVSQDNAKNKVLGGLMGIADNTKNKIVESGESNLTISYANSGREVLVFFNKALKLD